MIQNHKFIHDYLYIDFCQLQIQTLYIYIIATEKMIDIQVMISGSDIIMSLIVLMNFLGLVNVR